MEAGFGDIRLSYELADGKARILRCYGLGDVVVLPAQLEGYPVTELGPYLFSSGLSMEPEETGNVDLPVLCGERVRQIELPSTLEKIGRYAFYNCDGLRALKFYSRIRDIGGGAFNGCRKITNLEVRIIPGEKSCLKEILTELNEKVEVRYLLGWEKNVEYREPPNRYGGVDRHTSWERDGGAISAAGEGEARLIFPTFYEEAVEHTPARILVTHTHGCGHRYRYCFKDTVFLFKEYDEVFPYARAQESEETVVELSLLRLMFPLKLSDQARKEYERYLVGHLEKAGEILMEKNDMEGFRWLVKNLKTVFEHASERLVNNEGLAERAREGFINIGQSALGEAEFGILIDAAGRLHHAEALSCLMDEKHRLFKTKPKRFKL